MANIKIEAYFLLTSKILLTLPPTPTANRGGEYKIISSAFRHSGYKPFGDTLYTSGREHNRHQGYEAMGRDPESQYINMGARLYDPVIGRFLSVDPLWEAFRSFTPYHYAYNSPISYKDPSGLAPKKEKGDRVMAISTLIGSEAHNARQMIMMLAEMERVANDLKNSLYSLSMGKNSMDEHFGAFIGTPGGGGRDASKKKDASSDGISQFAKKLARSIAGLFGWKPKLREGFVEIDSYSYEALSESEYNDWLQYSEAIDGSSLFLQTYTRYQFGRGKPMFVDANSLGLSSWLRQRDLIPGEGFYSVDLTKHKINLVSIALGKISLQSVDGDMFRIKRDRYDFNIEWRSSFSKRNILTAIAGFVHGPVFDGVPLTIPHWPYVGPSTFFGGPFYIYFIGTVTIRP